MLDAAAATAPLIGGEVFALDGFTKLRDSLNGITVLSTGSLPDADFSQRYRGSDPFAPEPGLLAMLTYHATTHATLAAREGSRDGALRAIVLTDYPGYNGALRFEDGYWIDAPINRFVYRSGELTEDIVE